MKELKDKIVDNAIDAVNTGAENVEATTVNQVEQQQVVSENLHEQTPAPSEVTEEVVDKEMSKSSTAEVAKDTYNALKKGVDGTVKVVGSAAKVADEAVKVADNAVSGVAKIFSFVAKLGNMGQVGLIILGVVAVVGVLGTLSFAFPNFSLFGGDLTIEKTANLVEEVKKISEFTTANYYEDYLVQCQKKVKRNKLFGGEEMVQCEIVFSVSGKVRAGFDMSLLTDESFSVNGKTLNITLPAPQIFDVITNPSDYSTFERTGDWSHEEIVAMQVEGKEALLAHAHKIDILGKANDHGKDRIIALFQSMGFEEVNVTLTPPSVVEIAGETPAVEVAQEQTIVDEEPIVEVIVEEAPAEITWGVQTEVVEPQAEAVEYETTVEID